LGTKSASKNDTPKDTSFQSVIQLQYKHFYMRYFFVFLSFFYEKILKAGKTEQE